MHRAVDQRNRRSSDVLTQAFGHLPARGETIDIDGYQFKVAMADSRRIIQVHVRIPDDSP
ncbi:hypothetical protein ONQ62_27630, partial [Salmonella enterica subsp. enterica serovar Virginia]|nr:hypothetical protein [Salmonella enterica subsp. enterica serovar Virginia]